MTVRPYRYYLIDLDRTLWDFDSNSEHAIGLLISRNPVLYRTIQEKEGCGEDSLHRFFMRYDVLNHRLWAMYERGEMSKKDLRWKRFYEAFRWYGVEDEALSRQFGEDYLEQMVCENRLMPGAREMLEAIRTAGGKMAILSNGPQAARCRHSGIFLGSGSVGGGRLPQAQAGHLRIRIGDSVRHKTHGRRQMERSEKGRSHDRGRPG